MIIRFPENFVWGCATSAYQIEGGTRVGGRGEGIWDAFSRRPGAIERGETAESACDHLNRYREDVALMRELGVGAYRFSVSWPRIKPQGVGRTNEAGLDFYDRLVDELLAAGIEPWLTLYHWDLPQALQEQGGWTNRAVKDWFSELALCIAERLGDRIRHFMMLNEATMTAHRGHAYGTDAPGIRDRAAFFAATHHQNLAQGQAIRSLRECSGSQAWRLGTVILVQPTEPATSSEEDAEAARIMDAYWNRNFLDPLLRGEYPGLSRKAVAAFVRDGDEALIAQHVDFLGINYYVRNYARADPGHVLGVSRATPPAHAPTTPFGMEIYPEGLCQVLRELKNDYGNPLVYITENGYSAVTAEPMDEEGVVQDDRRIRYHALHLAAVRRTMDEGTNVAGYFPWSFMDNMEWSAGYRPRFGLVHVDYATQKRTPKKSFHWFRKVIESGALDLDRGQEFLSVMTSKL